MMKGKLSSRRKRKLHSMKRAPSFADCQVIHAMWTDYATSLMRDVSTESQVASRLQHADLHGYDHSRVLRWLIDLTSVLRS